MDTILSVRNLIKTYGDLIAVNSLSFDVRRGEIFGFLGPNGAGKTTSINIMSGLETPDSGQIDLRCSAGANSIGVCPQNIVIWENMTCLEQLSYIGQMYDIPRSISRKKATDLLISLGLESKKNKLAKTLSGGMKRRLNIALALVHEPEIVFLDEPQAGLDPQSRVLVRDYIRSIKNRTTIILTTHDMEEAEKLSDRVCIIDRGSTLVVGTTEEIKRSHAQQDIVELEIHGDIRTDLLPYLNGEDLDYTQTAENSASFPAKSYRVFEKIFSVLSERDIQINNLQLRKRSLEDVFIQLTGRSLRE